MKTTWYVLHVPAAQTFESDLRTEVSIEDSQNSVNNVCILVTFGDD